MTLPEASDPPYSYRLEIPAHAGWITLNKRGAWYVMRPLIRTYRELGHVLSLRAGLPHIERAALVAELRFSTNHRRDPHNWMPTAKAVLDGMVDAGVFPDDSHKHITGPDMRLGPIVDRDTQHLVMHIWPQP